MKWCSKHLCRGAEKSKFLDKMCMETTVLEQDLVTSLRLEMALEVFSAQKQSRKHQRRHQFHHLRKM